MRVVGTVSGVWRYPLKSMGGEFLTSANVGLHGVAGDRAYALRDEKTGLITNGKKLPKLMICQARYLEEPDAAELTESPDIEVILPGGGVLCGSDAEISSGLSDFCERRLTLVRRSLPSTFFDVQSVHLVTSASVARVQAALPNSTVSAIRFRPNLLIDTGLASGWVENDWCGSLAQVGSMELRAGELTERCSMVMRAQKSVPEDAAVLRKVVEFGNRVGIYCSVVRPGVVAIGSTFKLAS